MGFVPTSRSTHTKKNILIYESQKANQGTIRLNKRSKGIKKPPVTIQFLLVLFFKTEYNLHGACACRYFAFIGNYNTRCIPNNAGLGVTVYYLKAKYELEYMSSDILSTNGIFGDTLLITTHLQNA